MVYNTASAQDDGIHIIVQWGGKKGEDTTVRTTTSQEVGT